MGSNIVLKLKINDLVITYEQRKCINQSAWVTKGFQTNHLKNNKI